VQGYDSASGSKPLLATIVLYEGFELLDAFGPAEFLGLSGQLQVQTAGLRTGAVSSSCPSVSGQSNLLLEEVGETDILLVPGGIGSRTEVKNTQLIAQLHRLSELARYVCSVCTGAALLAKTGLLDGCRATTNKRAFDWVVQQRPEVCWIPAARWVEDGRFFTSSGVSAGMDMTIALLERAFGSEVSARCVSFAEYVPNQDPDNDPFARQPMKEEL